MRTIRPTSRTTSRSPARSIAIRLAAPLAAAAFAIGVATAAPAMATTADPGTVPAAGVEVCAPGAMTITRGGPTVYDGVDCTPGPQTRAGAATAAAPGAVAGSAESTTPAPPADPAVEVPFGTELRPSVTTFDGTPAVAVPAIAVTVPDAAPSTSGHFTLDTAGLESTAEQAAAVVAAFAGVMGLYHFSRRRQHALRTAGAQ